MGPATEGLTAFALLRLAADEGEQQAGGDGCRRRELRARHGATTRWLGRDSRGVGALAGEHASGAQPDADWISARKAKNCRAVRHRVKRRSSPRDGYRLRPVRSGVAPQERRFSSLVRTEPQAAPGERLRCLNIDAQRETVKLSGGLC